jgi:predicted O-methyltransferase YrrM
MSAKDWTRVDEYLAGRVVPRDPSLEAALAANAKAGLPQIDVSPLFGRFLHLTARAIGARRILEIGTLGGYSSIWLARALPENGSLITLEVDPRHAAVARRNVDAAGIGAKVDIRIGPALQSLAAIAAGNPAPFDLFFIDADKHSNAAYVDFALRLSRPGSVIVVDNVVREGEIADPEANSAAVLGTRRLFDLIAREPRLTATALQTVGIKGWDGFAMLLVEAA